MDPRSYWEVSCFVVNHLDRGRTLKILDVGALDINGCVRGLFQNPTWHYTGFDLVAGNNVDVVGRDPYHWPFDDQSFEVLVSVSTLEHVEDIYAWSDESYRVLKPAGLICVCVPFKWEVHQYPVDCWRFCPDGFRFLFVKRKKFQELDIRQIENSSMMIARK